MESLCFPYSLSPSSVPDYGLVWVWGQCGAHSSPLLLPHCHPAVPLATIMMWSFLMSFCIMLKKKNKPEGETELSVTSALRIKNSIRKCRWVDEAPPVCLLCLSTVWFLLLFGRSCFLKLHNPLACCSVSCFACTGLTFSGWSTVAKFLKALKIECNLSASVWSQAPWAHACPG